ncbi:protein AF-9 [Alosa pseudoharengus]|uniref:protein AF-9 n=1 Tax=Alosa pseudoharengus TaxID=34774 RepID=UPI003F89E950
MVMQEGSTSLFGQHLKLPTLPSSSLTFSFPDLKKSKPFPGSKDASRSSGPLTLSSSSSSSSSAKLAKPAKEHRDKPPRASKEPRSAFRELGKEGLPKPPKDSSTSTSTSSSTSSKKPKDCPSQPPPPPPLQSDLHHPHKMGFKEPKGMVKEPRTTEGGFGGAGKRLPGGEGVGVGGGQDHVTKKRKKGFPVVPHAHVDKTHTLTHTHTRDKGQARPGRPPRVEGEGDRRKAPAQLPFQELVDPVDSDMEDNMSAKSESEQPSPASSSSSSSSSFGPTHKRQALGPLRSIIQDLPSDDNEEDSEEDDDNDMDSDLERPMHTHLTHRHRRVSLSDGSDSENSSASSPLSRNEGPPLLKSSNNQILDMKSTLKQPKQEKTKTIDCDKAYLDELVELHKRLMALRERHILQQIVNLIEETGHFHITNTTFDFDLCSLDKPTVRKLQSYLETSGTS